MRTSSPDVVTSKFDEHTRLREQEMPIDPLPKHFMCSNLSKAYYDVNSELKKTLIMGVLKSNYKEMPIQESVKTMCNTRMMALAEVGLKKMISPIKVVTDNIMPTQMYDLGKDQYVRTQATSGTTPLAQEVCAVQDGVDGLLLLNPKTNA